MLTDELLIKTKGLLHHFDHFQFFSVENFTQVVFISRHLRVLRKLKGAAYVQLEGSPNEVNWRAVMTASYKIDFAWVVVIGIDISYNKMFNINR